MQNSDISRNDLGISSPFRKQVLLHLIGEQAREWIWMFRLQILWPFSRILCMMNWRLNTIWQKASKVRIDGDGPQRSSGVWSSWNNGSAWRGRNQVHFPVRDANLPKESTCFVSLPMMTFNREDWSLIDKDKKMKTSWDFPTFFFEWILFRNND